MKAKTILILLVGYFAISFLFNGSNKTAEKLLDSMKILLPIFIGIYIAYKYLMNRKSEAVLDKSPNNHSDNDRFKIPSRYKYMESLSRDSPIDFGIKTVWIAVQANSIDDIANHINLENKANVDWVEGTIRAYEGEIFVTPKLGKWILLHGMGLPTPDYELGRTKCVELLNHISKKYGKAYLFGNHRVSSVAFWSKSSNGELERLYVVADGTGETFGNPSKLEKEWNLIDLSKEADTPNEEDWDKLLYPGEDEVIEMAKYWSINPLKISQYQNVEGKGIIGRMNNRL